MDDTDWDLLAIVPPPPTQGNIDLAFYDYDFGFMGDERALYTSADLGSSSQASSLASRGEDGGRGTTQPTVKRRFERKSHTKSRMGCSNCKRRRIKCSETQPACGYCVKKGIRCEYPRSPQIIHQPHDQIPLFSLEDMRCFQHFMLRCYPHHPLGNEDVWTHEVPCLSQSHEHLMHAILAVAASDLAEKDQSLLPAALSHRLKAVEAIKRSLSDMDAPGSVTYEGANALLATCLALTVQSVCLDDGMVEYMTFFRGLLVVGMQMWKGGFKPMFANLADGGAQAVLEPHIVKLPLVPGEWTDAAVGSLEGLVPVCSGPVARDYHTLLLDWARTLYVSSWEAYKALEKHYMWWILLPHATFQAVIDTNSQPMLLLAAHWIALQIVTASISGAYARAQKKDPGNGGMDVGMLRWLRYTNARVDGEHVSFNQWPVWVQAQVERDPGFFLHLPS